MIFNSQSTLLSLVILLLPKILLISSGYITTNTHLSNKLNSKRTRTSFLYDYHTTTIKMKHKIILDETTKSSSTSIPKNGIPKDITTLPKLIVFDLDNTIWTPELYQLRKLQRSNIKPIAHKDVKLYKTLERIIKCIRNNPNEWKDVTFGIASRTKSVEWAKDLLHQFGLNDFFTYKEIFPGDKIRHFTSLLKSSNSNNNDDSIDYSDMLFFDDNRDGKYGNCIPVAKLGVCTVHCPNGIYEDTIWINALQKYQQWKIENGKEVGGAIIEWDGSLTTLQDNNDDNEGKSFEGIVKVIKYDKRFGFIKYNSSDGSDVFFHFNQLQTTNGYIDESTIKKGDKLSFTVGKDNRNGKLAATNVKILPRTWSISSSTMTTTLNNNKIDNNNNGNKEQVSIKVFSMNNPFATLLANGYKTIETRNGTMFTPYPTGTKFLLHVGKRIYPDGDRHIDVMKSDEENPLSNEQITKLKSLPSGYNSGTVVAIVEIGNTYETTLEQRSEPNFQRSVCAFGNDSGMRATDIIRAELLKRPVHVSGRGGVFKINIDKDVIPDGWL